MARTPCIIDDCETPNHARGLCPKHYSRLRRNGSPHATPSRDHGAIFLRSTERRGDCLIWTGTIGSDGYGTMGVNGKTVRAHRFAYEREHGPIPEGMYVDHICWNRICCNVEHLRLATPQENLQNLSGARKGRKHDLPRNVYPYTASGGGYQVIVRGVYGGQFREVAEAAARAAELRAELFGEFAGAA